MIVDADDAERSVGSTPSKASETGHCDDRAASTANPMIPHPSAVAPRGAARRRGERQMSALRLVCLGLLVGRDH